MNKREWKKIRDFEEIKFERWNHIAKPVTTMLLRRLLPLKCLWPWTFAVKTSPFTVLS